MEDMIVVYFYLEQEAVGKERRRHPWKYNINRKTLVKEPVNVQLIRVFLPSHARKKKSWTSETWQEYWNGLPVPHQGRTVYYLFEEKVQQLLQWAVEPLPWEWVQFLMSFYQIHFDALVLLQDREMEAFQIVQHYAKDTYYLGVATSHPKEWEEMEEALSGEYGFLLDVSETLNGLHIPPKTRTLILAGEKVYGATPAMLPEGCVWISTDTQGEAGRNICARAKGVVYIGMQAFLRKLL